jgi:hypothetical protein
MKDELLDGSSAKAAADAAQRGNLLMNALWSIVGGYKQAESAEPSDDAIKRTLDYLHHKAQEATYFTASDPGEVLSLWRWRGCKGILPALLAVEWLAEDGQWSRWNGGCVWDKPSKDAVMVHLRCLR